MKSNAFEFPCSDMIPVGCLCDELQPDQHDFELLSRYGALSILIEHVECSRIVVLLTFISNYNMQADRSSVKGIQ